MSPATDNNWLDPLEDKDFSEDEAADTRFAEVATTTLAIDLAYSLRLAGEARL